MKNSSRLLSEINQLLKSQNIQSAFKALWILKGWQQNLLNMFMAIMLTDLYESFQI